ncbi:MAG: NAD(P)-dependent oxidoreductase [Verrucomicrobiae bacterium]|nr:NAD(P)-dependent oxidoreductase [Verrucomicrobiae bacterium]
MEVKVLITGGAGYIGSVLCQHLLEAGHQIVVLDSVVYGQTSLFQYCANPKFDFIFGDARDESLLAKLLPKADVIIPLAAVVGAPACDRDPITARSLNFDAIRILNRLRSKQQLVIYPNTNSGYGTRSGGQHCTEETPLEPISLYGQTKCEAEQLLLDSPNSITLRLATVFGTSPRMRLDLLVNHFTYAAVTDRYIVLFEKHFQRNFVHIRDVADCFLHCLKNAGTMVGRPYNCGLDAANMTKEQLALKVKEQVPDFYLHFADIGEDLDKRNYIVSNQRLREAGFEARRSVDDGIGELIKCYRMMRRSAFKNV